MSDVSKATKSKRTAKRTKALCDTCKFFQITRGGDGECRRLPPTKYGVPGSDYMDGAWPIISRDDWCGEWVAGKSLGEPGGVDGSDR